MKTQKDKIIEILKDLIPPPKTWLGHPEDRIPVWESRINRAATRIQSETRTLSESKVHDILTEKFPDYNVPYCCDVAEQICSLAIPEQPAMSEDEIHNLAYEYTLYTESWEIKQEAFIAGFKAALSQTKKK